MKPNVLDAAPIDVAARRVARTIKDPAVAARFARLAFDELLGEPRNFRSATREDIEKAEAWARRAWEDGRTLSVFAPHRLAMARLRRIARRLAETCAEIEDIPALPSAQIKSQDIAVLKAAHEFVSKIERASFKVLDDKTRLFARERRRRLADQEAAKTLFRAEQIWSSPGRVWRRIVSVADLWATGAEFKNCLNRGSSHISSYARMMASEDAQFWVLRDHDERGLMVAMLCTRTRTVREARGPRNATIAKRDADLQRLLQAKGWWDGDGGGPAAGFARAAARLSVFAEGLAELDIEAWVVRPPR